MDSDSDEIGQQQALPVADFDTFDPSKPPMTGEEYLRRVQLEANNCPAIVVADIETSKYNENRSCFADSTDYAHVSSIFPIYVQEAVCNDFKALHRRLQNLRGSLSNRQPQVYKVSDENYWRSLCIGIPGGNGEGRNGSSSSSSSISNSHEVSQSINQVKNGSPSVTMLLALSQEELLQLLEYQSNWISQYGFFDQNSLWIFSLLSCLESPLNGDAYSLLRNVARAIVKQIHSKAIVQESSISAHLIICVIARCFNQWDLIQT